MADIQRYSIDGHQPESDGYWVTYTDHVAAVAAARAEEARAWAWPDERNAYELGIKAARDAVDACRGSEGWESVPEDAIDALTTRGNNNNGGNDHAALS